MSRFDQAIAAIDTANAADPNREMVDGEMVSKELAYSRRMSAWLEKIAPEASEPLKLAARAQHICRWQIPRSDYPEGKKSYHLWRTTLYRHHADITGGILEDAGYPPDEVERTRQLLLKKNLRSNAEMQTLEDVICLVFLENYFSDFAGQHDDEKIIGIVRKTWKKMSPRGHDAALTLTLPKDAQSLVEQALAAP